MNNYSLEDLRNLKETDSMKEIFNFFRENVIVSHRNLKSNNLFCFFTNTNSENKIIREYFLDKFKDIEYTEINGIIYYLNENALDLLSRIYDSNFYFPENHIDDIKYNNYLDWVTFGLGTSTIPNCIFYKSDPEAITPSKNRASDVGYDLTIIKEIKKIGSKTVMYDTGIVVAPDLGFYTKIVPRSSITKTGYILTNSTGIIDGSFRGSLKICLTKIDDTLPDIVLPCKIAQLIIDRSIHYKMKEATSLEDLGITNRGEGGFGSTDLKK